MASGKQKAKEQQAQIAAMQSERDEMSVTRTRQDLVRIPDYEWYVELAAKGMAERDNHPMPKSVSTPEAFYEVMAGAALDAIDLRALLERSAGAERTHEIAPFGRADANTEHARHQRRPEQ